ncbi:IQ motif and SEC7 domain-containing protein 2 [Hypsibius exemplaris]|uniref:IQ motif and SEC7 domain-containing protein 2 n=1 Tax=Hypsibius exemplaris TaxID=2072580 RepID=A0A1W0X8G2_HYPEX|nr:IQ motif and SEC7 domain-containing protein 2 [Hypsibius exemplaris]
MSNMSNCFKALLKSFSLSSESFFADSIPRSKTTDNGNWNISVVRHPIGSAAASAAACRPQSALYPTCYPVVHPTFQSIKHGGAAGAASWSDQASSRRRYSRDRGSLYELSQDLQDKQLELLERKYGGRLRARHAALVIQRAYRRFSMQRKFEVISSANHHHQQNHVVYRGDFNKTKSVYEVPADDEVINSRPKNGMTRSTSATTRLPRAPPPRHLEDMLSPSDSTGLYDNLPGHHPHHSRYDAAPPPIPDAYTSNNNLARRNYNGEALPPYPKTTVHPPATNSHDGLPRRTGAHHREHRSRQPSSRSPVRNPTAVASGNLGIVHSGAAVMSSVSICDVPLSTTSTTVAADQSPVWKRLDEQQQQLLTDQDSGLGSNAQLNTTASPAHLHHHHAFLDYDNLPSMVATAFLSGEIMPSSPPQPSSTASAAVLMRNPGGEGPTSPRRNSESARIMLAVNGAGGGGGNKVPQRRAVSASRVPNVQQQQPKLSETKRKRQYRVGLNLFNKKPERGMEYLIEKGFVVQTPSAIARFLISRKGLSKQKIGEYLGNHDAFCIAALECFAGEIDLCGLEIDQAMRKFQTYFRLPGEAQKISRVLETFSSRYMTCNSLAERIFLDDLNILRVAYGIIMLNTDLHNPSIRKERKMSQDDFIKNMRGALSEDTMVNDTMLREIYMRIKGEEFKPGNDHVSQVQRVDKQIIGDNKPVLPLPHRRLVCFCRLYEVYDETRKERSNAHQREVFLFNDLMVVTKQNGARKKNSPIIYRCRMSFPLIDTEVVLFSTAQHPNGLKLVNRSSKVTLVMLNARNEHDRDKFVEDLQESIKEMDEMETLRVENEVEKQRFNVTLRATENRDSGVADVLDDSKSNSSATSSSPDHVVIKRAVILSNSLLDMSDQQMAKHAPVTRRGSTASLDSGMCMPGSSAASTQSTPSSEGPASANPKAMNKPSILSSFFTRKSGKYQI